MIIVTHLITVNTIIDFKTFKIVILVNSTDKTLKITKKVRLNTIYKYANVIYIMINIFRTFTILTITTAAIFFIEPFTSVQKDIFLDNRYKQNNISLISIPFFNTISTINAEFIFIPDIETKL